MNTNSAEVLYLENKPDLRVIDSPKANAKIGKSTRMECLYTDEEIRRVYSYFDGKVKKARTRAKMSVAMRNRTMFVCAIGVRLRGGDFCSLKWGNLYDSNWVLKRNPDFVPEKTEKFHKHITLHWNSDFEKAIEGYRQWLISDGEELKLENPVFISQKGTPVDVRSWWRVMSSATKAVGITQKVGTHGLRKTGVHRYIEKAPDKSEALMEMSCDLGHSDVRITSRYACITDEKLREGVERTSIGF